MAKKSKFSFKKSSTLGIDIGSTSTKIVKLTHKDGQNSILEFAGIFEGDPKSENFIPELKKFISSHKLSGSSSASSLDDNSMKIRKLELPKMPDADLKEAVKWKMRDIVDGDIEDFIVRWSHLPGSGDGKQISLVGYAVKKSAATQLKQILTKIGTHPEYIEPAIVSLSAACGAVNDDDEQWTGCIDIGPSNSIMSIMGNGKFYFSRPLPGIRINPKENVDNDFLQRVAAEVQNTIDTFSVLFKAEGVQKIYLSGGGALSGNLADYLSTNLGVACEVIKPFANIDISPEMNETVQKSGHLFTQALALARIQL